jgi:glucosyl-dolichyl phosphate glucuronosyltransferase
MSISVLIATYNRSPALAACLAQLSRQRFVAGDEVIVVDNGSTDETASVVARTRQNFPVRLEYLREPRAGKSHALALGLTAARGALLAFTDDDVLVADDWLFQTRRILADPDVDLAGGRVWPAWEGAAPAWLDLRQPGHGFSHLAAPLALLDYGDEPAQLGPRTVLGANLVVRRAVFDAAGGFPTELGKLRGTLLSGEDDELCRRVQAAGFQAIYHPALLVHHRVPRDRTRLSYYLRWFYWSGITHASLDDWISRSAPVQPARTLLGVPRYVARRIPQGLAAAIIGALTLRPTSALEGATDMAFGVGYAAFCLGWARLDPRTPPAEEHGLETA